MCAEIVDGSASEFDAGFPGFRAGDGGLKPVEVGLEFDETAEGVAVDEMLDGKEVLVPAAVYV